jgi:hypothetical protein
MRICFARFKRRGSALLVVMMLGSISLFVLAATMSWTAATSVINDDAVRHSVAVAAAEAATESAIAELAMDFSQQGAGALGAKLDLYKKRIPKASQHPHWGKFKFNNGKGKAGEVEVELVSPWAANRPLLSQYEGLKGYAATYRITSNAADIGARRNLIGAVQQDVQLALIPVFQFAIFYNLGLEINPGADMTIRGRTHGNKNMYLQPSSVTLTFVGDVTSAGEIVPDKMPGDPVSRSKGNIIFKAGHDSGVMSLNLPIGTANTPEAVREIVELPPNNESPNSEMGKQRFCNNADLVILVKDNGVDVRGGGMANGTGANLKWSSISNFVTITNATMYDAREQKTVRLTEIDVAGFASWNANSQNALKNALQRDINSIYVADLRTNAPAETHGIRLVNGATLPPLGLTVATPNPLYVKGHYNASGASLASHNTTNTKPAALVADAITVLSGNWADGNSAKVLSYRTAANTTVNAAFLAGIVETGNGYYSGGVENFPRFLENWSSRTFTYNGSMVVLYKSQHATGPWRGTGTTYQIYNPPVRDWSFDTAFLDPARLPPLTPSVRAVIRGQWQRAAPGALASNN